MGWSYNITSHEFMIVMFHFYFLHLLIFGHVKIAHVGDNHHQYHCILLSHIVTMIPVYPHVVSQHI